MPSALDFVKDIVQGGIPSVLEQVKGSSAFDKVGRILPGFGNPAPAVNEAARRPDLAVETKATGNVQGPPIPAAPAAQFGITNGTLAILGGLAVVVVLALLVSRRGS
jgi:hypothetical protein